jgi:hypothetical protein
MANRNATRLNPTINFINGTSARSPFEYHYHPPAIYNQPAPNGTIERNGEMQPSHLHQTTERDQLNRLQKSNVPARDNLLGMGPDNTKDAQLYLTHNNLRDIPQGLFKTPYTYQNRSHNTYLIHDNSSKQNIYLQDRLKRHVICCNLCKGGWARSCKYCNCFEWFYGCPCKFILI